MITQEMKDAFYARTKKHVDCVGRNLDYISKYYPKYGFDLVKRSYIHDKSKFDEPELTPYILVNWKYKCKDLGIPFNPPDNIQDMMNEATNHHINTNKHHPEYWDPRDNKVNPNDRDAIPDVMVNAHAMDDISIIEMCCDWHAMGLERNNTAKEWADKNVNIRWRFTEPQVSLIYECLERLVGQKSF